MSSFSENIFAVLDEEVDEHIAPQKEGKKKAAEPKPSSSERGGKTIPKATGNAAARSKHEGRRREHDRHSGAVESEKKIKQGHTTKETEEAIKDDNNNDDAAEKEKITKEEEKVKTLDEYLAEQANKSFKISLPEVRKANDADEYAFKGTIALKKKDHEAFIEPTIKETKPPVKKEKTSKKVVVNIEQRFVEEEKKFTPRGGGHHRGRGRGQTHRGGHRGRGGGRNKRAGGPTVNIQDVSAFPSLGA